MRGTVLYAPRDIRVEERQDPEIEKPTDAVIRLAATCVAGDEWHWHGAAPDHFMTHLSLTEGDTRWGEQVTDPEYGQPSA